MVMGMQGLVNGLKASKLLEVFGSSQNDSKVEEMFAGYL